MKIYLKIYSFHSKFLTQLDHIINKYLKLFNYNYKGPIYLPTKRSKYTLLRSPHVYKDAREQFGIYIYKRLYVLNILNLSLNEKDRLKYIIQLLKSKSTNVEIKVIYIIN